ncbi:type II secretion system F family protein [Reinekea thalattae]|uniref:Type II secretion system F family protein n=1 Tax=Reinekea thalattae TaxID=2593301 RepID=A0A5C8Z431_9GAMM|nr:type II secretion system F family protein [Reinekea thalattae]TXR52009.1 type II secretion system F family protein [Reinekea thalattae]
MANQHRPQSFSYQAFDSNGQLQTGQLTASNAAWAQAMLRQQGLQDIQQLKPIAKTGLLAQNKQGLVANSKAVVASSGLKSSAVHGDNHSKTKQALQIRLFEAAIRRQDITLFTRQLAIMVKTGMPLLSTFDLVAENLNHPRMKLLIAELKQRLSNGGSLSSALRAYPKYFDSLYCGLIEAGEQAGALETMLERVAEHREQGDALKRKIQAALRYPAIVLVVAVLVSAILLIKVVPTFESLFSSFSAPLPLATQLVIQLARQLGQWWPTLLIGLLGVCALSLLLYQKTLWLKRLWHYCALRLPIIGSILFKSIMVRFARTLATTYAAGVPLNQALSSVAGALNHSQYQQIVEQLKQRIEEGDELAKAMSASSGFSNLLTQMVSVGEQTGTLDRMLNKAAHLYEQEIKQQIDALTDLVEPLMITILGIIVGGLVVSMYLPIFQMGSAI